MNETFEIFLHYGYLISRFLISVLVIVLLFNINRLVNKIIKKQ